MNSAMDIQNLAISSDLVVDTKIKVSIHEGFTIRHISQSASYSGQYVARQETKEYWKPVKDLGTGGFGSVKLHERVTKGMPRELQAIKVMDKERLSSVGLKYADELQAIAKFSQDKVCRSV